MNEQIEAIRNEIERRMETAIAISEDPETRENELAQTLFEGKAMAYKDMLRYLDTLEASENIGHLEGFDEAARQYAGTQEIYWIRENPYTSQEFAFKAGAEWQKEQMMNEWLQDRDGCFWDGVEEGKKAMREQMLKEIEDAKDFEKVLADVFQSATTLVSSPSELVDAFKGKLLRSAFKCFAEKKALRQSLFAKQFSELPDEIKAVIERIAHDSCYTFCESFASLVAADKSYRKGKHDMKEQMMKDAVEGEVVQDMQGVNRVKTFGEIPEWLHFGDKVRIIIVKEDKQ